MKKTDPEMYRDQDIDIIEMIKHIQNMRENILIMTWEMSGGTSSNSPDNKD